MIVEITGAPGSGKTTLLHKIGNKNDINIVLFSDDLVLKRFKLDFITPNIIRRILSDTVLLLIFLRHFNNHKTFMRRTVSLLLNNREQVLTKLNVLRNIILKLGRFYFIEKNFVHEVVLVDEGISHIPFTLIDYSGKTKTDINLILEPLSALMSRVKVIIFDLGSIDIKRRLHIRGHKRIQNNKKTTSFLNKFAHLNNQVVESYKSLQTMKFLDKRLLRVGTENDEEQFMNILNS